MHIHSTMNCVFTLFGIQFVWFFLKLFTLLYTHNNNKNTQLFHHKARLIRLHFQIKRWRAFYTSLLDHMPHMMEHTHTHIQFAMQKKNRRRRATAATDCDLSTSHCTSTKIAPISPTANNRLICDARARDAVAAMS